MFRKLSIVACLAAGLWLTQGAAVQAQQSEGPVREGLRRTGEAVVEGGKKAARATGEAVRRTGEAAKNTVERTAQGAANATRRLTGREPIDSRNDSTNAAADTQQRHEASYRGSEQDDAYKSSQPAHQGRVYTLHHDCQGREFICVCGSRVYFDGSSNESTETPSSPEPYQAARPTDDGLIMDSQDDVKEQTDTEAADSKPADSEERSNSSDSADKAGASQEKSADAEASANSESEKSGKETQAAVQNLNESESE